MVDFRTFARSIARATFVVAAVASVSFGATGCKENIDESAYAIADKSQIIELLQADTAQYSQILELFNEVKLGTSSNASSLTSVLSSRGNYTVFAPTNEAVNNFLKGLGLTSISQLTDQQKKMIVYNCIIDNGDESAYELSDFSATGATFDISTLDDRRLTSEQKDGTDYYINGDSKIINSNIEASNGMLHVVNTVIYPSSQSVAELIAETPTTRVIGQLLKETGLDEDLQTQTEKEDEYTTEYASRLGTTEYFEGQGDKYPFMSKRRIRFTAFVETDSVLYNEWQVPLPVYDEKTETITNWSEIMSVISKRCAEALGEAESSDYTNPDNPVNKFMAYHLLNGGMPLNGMVSHYNEYGYDVGSDYARPQTKNYSVNVWDYYTTLGTHRALLKVTQLCDDADPDHNYYLNRISKYDDGFTGTYAELSHTENSVANGLNILINPSVKGVDENGEEVTYDNNALNGYFYTINHILINTEATSRALGSERIRMDVTTMLPEMLSNDLRISDCWQYFPQGYFDNITNEGSSTRIFYLSSKHAGGSGWKDAQGDEFLVTGAYNFVLKLPPVPKSGYYEVRMGTSNNSLRSMVQCYLDDTTYPAIPTGLPVDQRENAATDWDGTIWVDDEDNNYDEQICLEYDRYLRNAGYLKGPNYYCVNQTKGKTTVRNEHGYGINLRYILTRQYFDKDKTYYVRFKNAVENLNTQFFLDYFEFCPSEVYNNPDGEDIW